MTAQQEAFFAVLVAERDVSGLEEVLEEAVCRSSSGPAVQRGHVVYLASEPHD